MIRRQLVLLPLFFVLFQAMALAEMVAVNDEDINMRSGPGANTEVLWKMGTGFPLEIIKRSGEWIQVRDFEGSVGWVHKKTINTTPHMVVKANKGSENTVNIRSEPNTKAKVVAQAKYGVVFRTLEKKGDWVKVGHSQGVSGWVDTDLLWGF